MADDVQSQVLGEQELLACIGTELAPSNWLTISQERVNQFADATSDHQFIHTDAEKAAATPFGGTIAHGFLTLSLIIHLVNDITVKPAGTAVTINYGSDKIRYLTPVRVGKRIRALQRVLDVNQKRPGQWLVKLEITIEIEDSESPALVAEVLLMHVTDRA